GGASKGLSRRLLSHSCHFKYSALIFSASGDSSSIGVISQRISPAKIGSASHATRTTSTCFGSFLSKDLLISRLQIRFSVSLLDNCSCSTIHKRSLLSTIGGRLKAISVQSSHASAPMETILANNR